MTSVVLAVDGGNSKTDVVIVAESGELRGRVIGPTMSHQVIGARAGADRLAELVAEVKREAGSGRPRMGVYCLAGADFPSDVLLIKRELRRVSLADEETVMNDTFAALRAGAEKGWGVVLICGQGINAAAIAPNGRVARFAGIGDLSGDWGGGGGLGEAALASAIRGRDGRGPGTSLEQAVAAHFGRRTPEAVMLDMYEGRIPTHRRMELAPAVFQEARNGDLVARALIDRLADELAVMATALIRRLKVSREQVDVVLAGGVFNSTDESFYSRLSGGILEVAPNARLVRPKLPPVGGAALLALDRLSETGTTPAKVAARLHKSFESLEGK
jgi:N-acetylglucosamine kinase-like BadF-type ATPase